MGWEVEPLGVGIRAAPYDAHFDIIRPRYNQRQIVFPVEDAPVLFRVNPAE